MNRNGCRWQFDEFLKMEKHTFSTPAIISMPPDLKHCPLLVNNISKSVVFLEVSTTRAYMGKPEDKQV
jgi:hypothetical protein